MAKIRKALATLAATVLLGVASSPSWAQIIRIANQGDAWSLDPHSLNESLQISIDSNVYEALVGRNKDLSVAPALATSWKQSSPTVWRFELRRQVQFHDGSPFSADDVIFSFARAAGEGSDMKAVTADIKAVRKQGDHAIEIETRVPFPILPEAITHLMIMSRKWCEENQASAPADRRQGVWNHASSKANGTGPFRVREREPGVRTVFTRNPTYWGKIDGNVQEVIFSPMPDASARVTALLLGQVDVMEPVPAQDVARINQSSLARVISGPELRTIFLGMDQKRDELLYSSVKGRNPFKDRRVRQAFYQAIDIASIQRTVMRGGSRPAALLVGPGINGWTEAQDERLPFDVDAAKKLMAEAGYADGFELTMDCPNDRYVNDAQICEAVAANLAKINVKIRLQAVGKSSYFPKILRRDTSFYLLGWTPTTYDAHNVLAALTACPDGGVGGQFNLGGYCNPALDEWTRKIQSSTDKPRRDAMIKEAFALHAADVGHLPLHQQTLAWGVAKNVELTQLADNFMPFKWMSIKRK